MENGDMKIEFFKTENGMDPSAIKGGVYQVELIMEGKDPICLYIGESVWIASRCGTHLYALYENPAYFGLKQEDLDNEQLTIRFSVLEAISEKKSELGVGSYKERELKEIENHKPITQLSSSDRQIHLENEKIKKVQKTLFEKGYKNHA